MGEELQKVVHLGDFLVKAELSPTRGTGDRASNIDGFIKRLQEEMGKIDAFKRELPLSVILLNDAIEALKEEASHVNSSSADEPILAEFIPLRRSSEGKEVKTQKETDPKDKKNWMSSVQLWSSNPDHHHIQSTAQTPIPKPQSKNERELLKGTLVLRNRSGADLMEEQSSSGSGSASASVPFMRMLSSGRSGLAGLHQPLRKRRRCWAPELHRQFVNALEKLGGPQAATPKQIRELMQVDGLTNDEVKSHLQKYRLHSRRLPSTNNSSPSNQSAVLGNVWDAHEAGKCGESSRASHSQSGSPQGPFQLNQ